MTEAEWLACEDPEAMVGCLRERVSNRKLLLYCAAHRIAAGVARGEDVSHFELVIRYADGPMTPADVKQVVMNSPYPLWVENLHAWATDVANNGCGFHISPVPLGECVRLLRDIFGNPFRPVVFSSTWRTG